MAISEKCSQKGLPKVRGWLRHLPGLETPEQRTGAPLNKYGVFFPYKHQSFDLVPSGLWLYNPHSCSCRSKMLNTISMEWFQGNSGEQPRKESHFYHFNHLKQTQFQPQTSTYTNQTFHTFPVPLQQPPAE